MLTLIVSADTSAKMDAKIDEILMYVEPDSLPSNSPSIQDSQDQLKQKPPLISGILTLTAVFGSTQYPDGIAIQNNGNVVVAYREDGNFQIFNKQFELIKKINSARTSDDKLIKLSDVSLDQLNNIYVTDRGNHRIVGYDANGNFKFILGKQGEGISEFSNPFGIAVDMSGNIFVADTNNNRIQVFDKYRDYVTQWETTIQVDGKVKGPVEIDIDNEGNVYVAYLHGNIIKKFKPDGTELQSFGAKGIAPGQFNQIYDVVLHDDNVYVLDFYNGRIQKFTSDFNIVSSFGTLGTFGSYGTDLGQFYAPYEIAVDKDGTVYVAEKFGRIQVFEQI